METWGNRQVDLWDAAIMIVGFRAVTIKGCSPMLKTTSLVMLLIAVLLLSPVGSLAQSGSSPEFNITIDNVRPPTECKRSYWAITYDRTTTFSDLATSTLTRYFVQYINNDPNLVHYWESGYNAYVQDYWVSAGTRMNERARGSYTTHSGPIPIRPNRLSTFCKGMRSSGRYGRH